MYGKSGREEVHHDDRLEDGPITERSTTDIFFCLAFLGFWVFSVILLLGAKKEGDLSKLMRPTDGLHDCGFGQTSQHPYIFLNVDMSITTLLTAKEIMLNAYCVKQCPMDSTTWAAADCYIAPDDVRSGEPSRIKV